MSVVKVVYPLINKITGAKSEYYTMTNYDVYKYKKVKYVRGEPLFFTDDLTDRNNCYKLLQFKPLTIEESADYKNWKCEYNASVKKMSSADYIASYASYKMLTGK